MSITTVAPIIQLLEQASDHGASTRSAMSGAEKLASIYRRPGPYTTVYLARRPLLADAEADTAQRWSLLRQDLEAQCAPPGVLDAIEARLALPAPDDTSAVAVIAAADGTTIVEHGQDPPVHDVGVVDTLPYAGPLLEWHQRRIPHVVVTVDEQGADVACFGLDHYTRVDTVDGDIADVVGPVVSAIRDIGARLIVVSGDTFVAKRLADELTPLVPVSCRVIAETGATSLDELVESTVTHVADTAARATVSYLREFRYLASHQSAVDGTADTVAALRDGTADALLIHDDPDDQRRIWIGPNAQDISLESRSGWDTHARLVDAALRAAIASGIEVHIIPSTGTRGPDEDTAVLIRETADPVA